MQLWKNAFILDTIQWIEVSWMRKITEKKLLQNADIANKCAYIYHDVDKYQCMWIVGT